MYSFVEIELLLFSCLCVFGGAILDVFGIYKLYNLVSLVYYILIFS